MSKKVLPSKKQRKQKKSHNKNVASKTFYYNKPCMCCGNKLVRVSSTDRFLSTKEKRLRIFIEVYECQNKKCKLYRQKIKSPEFNALIFPGLSYGIDLIAEIGILRFKEHKSIPNIHELIIEKYPHIEISVRHMENVVKKFMIVLESGSKDPVLMKKRLFEKNKDLKGLVISVDGIQPERGNEILYVVREVQTGEILFATYLEFSDEKTLQKEIYEPLKMFAQKMKLPVLGLIADKQSVLTTAFQNIFPNSPVQHCQSHFLSEIRKPVREKDSEIASTVKKNSGD